MIKVRFILLDLLKITLLLATASGLISCLGTMPSEEEEAVIPEPISDPINDQQPTEILSPSERVRRAIQALQLGNNDEAYNQLNWALQDKPSLRIARRLMEQLEEDPIAYLGPEHFIYTVQPGESLSIIAQQFLDDSLKFVSLARYNGIQNPSNLKAGEQIKIPGAARRASRETTSDQLAQTPVAVDTPVSDNGGIDQPLESDETSMSEPVVDQPPPDSIGPVASGQPEPTEEESTEPSDAATTAATESADLAQPEADERGRDLTALSEDEILQSARQLHDRGDISTAVAFLENAIGAGNRSPRVVELLLQYYLAIANRLISDGELEGARAILEKAVILDSSNEQAINSLIAVEDRIEANRLYDRGVTLLEQGDLEAAYEQFSQANTYDPQNRGAAQALIETRTKLTDQYHRKALLLFRKHQLDEAIEYWDKILAIDPSHTLAPGYKARALELKKQLQMIDE